MSDKCIFVLTIALFQIVPTVVGWQIKVYFLSDPTPANVKVLNAQLYTGIPDHICSIIKYELFKFQMVG